MGPLADLSSFLTASPTPYHAVAEAVRRLAAAGFTEQVGDRRRGRRDPGGRCARARRHAAGLVAARRARPVADLRRAHRLAHPQGQAASRQRVRRGGGRSAVEVYGGALWNSWLDRDLGLAGRLARYDGSSALVDVHRPLLRVPQLAIHLDRAVNQGLTLDPQQHLLPVWGLGEPGGFLRVRRGAGRGGGRRRRRPRPRRVRPDPAGRAGRRRRSCSPRGGWTTWCRCTRGCRRCWRRGRARRCPCWSAFDHEEVGSASATGAAGPLLENVLTRLAGGFDARAEVFAASRASRATSRTPRTPTTWAITTPRTARCRTAGPR